MTVTAWAAVAVFLAAYALIATEKIHRVVAALGGAGIMLLIHATDAEAAFFSELTGIDWNVIFLLLGMMVIVGVLKLTGIFEYLAIGAVKRAKGCPDRLMVLLVVITAIASALLGNLTTVLLIAPVTFLVCERLALPAAPFLIAEAMASNIGGAATLVGDPPNVIIASRAGLSFNDFLIHMTPLVIILMVVFIGMCRILFRKFFRYDPERAAEVMALDEREAIADRRLLWQSLAVLALAMAAFVLHPVLHYEPSVVAILGAGILVAVTKVTTRGAIGEVEWPTLVFFAGLFVMVGALVETGVIGQISRAAAEATQGQLGLTTMGLLWASAGLQCGHPGHRGPQRHADQFLAVHQVWPGGDRGHYRVVCAVPMAALPMGHAGHITRAGRVGRCSSADEVWGGADARVGALCGLAVRRTVRRAG
ncbi:ArsB/NhaD family transporter [Nonomuraea sp. SYSU D8015]|uniref:SLC13 family permease n=1 Tax=Nonomuraea sp. SYSU D8015 TaxID=2593644 RepID=UPI00300D3E99